MADKLSLFERLQALDRRWIYIVVALAIIIPLMIPYNSDNVTSPPTENVYQMIDSYSGREDRAILLSFFHDASTMPELYPMQIAILRHCFERNVKVFFLSFLPTGAPIIDMAINTVKEEYPNIKSGTDYCNFGYIPAALIMQTIIGMGDDIATAVPTLALFERSGEIGYLFGYTGDGVDYGIPFPFTGRKQFNAVFAHNYERRRLDFGATATATAKAGTGFARLTLAASGAKAKRYFHYRDYGLISDRDRLADYCLRAGDFLQFAHHALQDIDHII